MSGPAQLEVELIRPGRHFGELRLPWSRDDSGYGRLAVPVITLIGSEGPSLLVTGGIHGDEYEGQLALMRLAAQIDPAALKGRLILVPIANPPASATARRVSPVDGANLARIFPGSADGSLSWQLAAGITRLLLPLADALVDLHSGGSTLDYLPCAFGRLPAEPRLARRTLGMIQAFGAPKAMLMLRPEASGTLVSAALERGIPAMATELGGGGSVTPATLRIARDGILRVAQHLGITFEAPEGAGETRLFGIAPEHFLRAPHSGMFEPALTLGQSVDAGEVGGWLWCAERPDLPPEPLILASGGIVVCRRVPVLCQKADVLLHLARPVQAEDLIG